MSGIGNESAQCLLRNAQPGDCQHCSINGPARHASPSVPSGSEQTLDLLVLGKPAARNLSDRPQVQFTAARSPSLDRAPLWQTSTLSYELDDPCSFVACCHYHHPPRNLLFRSDLTGLLFTEKGVSRGASTTWPLKYEIPIQEKTR